MKDPGHDAPVPVLQAHGFSGGIQSWNDRVQKVMDSYQAAHGDKPSAGLVFDVARAPLLDNQLGPKLFDVPQTPRRAQMRAAVNQQKLDGKTRSVRPDGMIDPDNHYKGMVAAIDHPSADYKNYRNFYTAKNGKYQMVPMGFIPGLPAGLSYTDVWKAAARSTDPKLVGAYGTMTLDEAEKITKNSTISSNTERLANPAQMASPSLVASAESQLKTYAKSIYTVGQVQKLLQKLDPQHFAGLKTSGYMTPDWVRGYSKWSRSDDFGMTSLQDWAKKNNFEPTQRGISDMNLAYRSKLAALNNPANIYNTHILEAVPLRLWKDLNWNEGYPHNPEQFFKNVWGDITTNTSGNSFVAGLQGGFRGVKLVFDAFSGGFNEGKAELQMMSALAGHSVPGIWGDKHMTREQVSDLIAANLKANPSWVKIMSGGYASDKSALAQTINFMVDLYAGTKFMGPGYKELPVGDPVVAKRSVAIAGASRLSFNSIKSGNLHQAVRELHGGRTAEQLVVATEKGIQDGSITFRDYWNHVVNLYSGFTTRLTTEGNTLDIDGHVLSRYANKYMRTPGPAIMTAKLATQKISALGNAAERVSRNNMGLFGNSTEVLLRGIRTQFITAIPKGSRYIFNDRFAHDVYTFAAGKGLMSRDAATELSNQIVRAKATNNVAQIGNLLQKLHDKYRAKYPLAPGDMVNDAAFEPFLETEQLSRFNFPSGGSRGGIQEQKPARASSLSGEELHLPSPVIELLSTAKVASKQILKEPVEATAGLGNFFNEFANRITKIWRDYTLITNVGRIYKHATRDPVAAYLGGWRVVMNKEMKQAQAEAYNYLSEHPDAFRAFSVSRGASTESELHWLSGDYWVDGGGASWNMTDFYKDKGIAALNPGYAARISSTAQYVRKMLTSNTYDAFIRSSTSQSLEPLVDLIMSNPSLKAAFFTKRKMQNKFHETLGNLEEHSQQGSMFSPTGGFETVTYARGGKVVKEKKPVLAPSEEATAKTSVKGYTELDEAHKYAQLIFNRFQELDKAARDAGTSLDEMWSVLHKNPGLADKALGDLLGKHMVPVTVHDGTIIIRNKWDARTEGIIGAYMKPNMWSRGKLFDHTFASMYSMFRKAGMDTPTAIEVASHAANQVTVTHMLDFVNQLEFEQRFRWAFPFFTKHRLYTMWLGSTAARYPGMVLPISDVQQHLDDRGRYNFSIAGTPLQVNALRLLWLNTHDQPATIPAAAFAPGPLKSLAGDRIFGSLEAPFKAALKLSRAHTYEDAVAGMDSASTHEIQRLMISYGLEWKSQHPDLPVPESSAVHYALVRYVGKSFVTGTMFSPVTFGSSQLPKSVTDAHDKYEKLYAEDPGKAANYLDSHPEVGLAFGIYKDTNVYWHTQGMFNVLKKLQTHRDNLERPLLDKFKTAGELTNEDLQGLRDIRRQYGEAYNQLLIQDAQAWQNKDVPGFPPGKVKRGADGKLHVIQPGPFGIGAGMGDASEKLDQWLTSTFPKLSKNELLKVWGQDQQLQQDFLNRMTPSWFKTQDDFRTVRSALNLDLTPYRDLTKDPGGQVVAAYMGARSKWFKTVQTLRDQLKVTSGSKHQEVQDQLRLADASSVLDSSFTYKGQKYQGPPFAISSYLDTPRPQRVQWVLKYLVNSSYDSLSSSDKIILGLKNTDPKLDAAWVAYHMYSREYADGQRKDYKGPQSGYKQYYAGVVNQQFPGFMKDWVNTQKPKYQLVQQYKPLQHSEWKDEWNQVLAVANAVYATRSSWNSTNRSEFWRYQIMPTLLPIIARMPKGFQDELTVAGGEKFLGSLMSQENG